MSHESRDGAPGGADDPRRDLTQDLGLGRSRDPQPGAASQDAASPETHRFERRAVEPGAPPAAEALPPEAPGRYGAPEAGPQLIGEGGMGRVEAVLDRILGRTIARKELLVRARGASTGASGAAPEDRFLREARVTAQLEHPGIVPVYDLGRREDGSLYYTMKRVKGRTLEAALRACGGPAERLALLGPFVGVCQALGYAHSRGVIHRDLKPGNVMLGEFGETVVLDWGLARLGGERDVEGRRLLQRTEAIRASDGLATEVGAVMGTPRYMSPEQARGDIEAVDARSDVWSLGVMLYEIVAGRSPYDGRTLPEIVAMASAGRVPPLGEVAAGAARDLSAIVGKAMAPAPADRYATADELGAEVEAWRTGLRVGAYSYSLRELLSLYVRRHRRVVAVAAASALLLLAVAATSYVRVVGERNRARAAEASARESEATARRHLAEALVGRASQALREDDPISARLFAVGALSIADGAEARGIAMRAARTWTPRLSSRTPVEGGCKVARFAPDGSLLCAGRALARLDRQGRTVTTSPDLGTVASCADVSPDGRLAAVGGPAGVSLVALHDGALRRVLAPDRAVTAVAFSRDGGSVIVASGVEGELSRWSVDGRLLAHDVEGKRVNDLAVDPGGATILVPSHRGQVSCRDAESLALLHERGREDAALYSASFGPGGTRVAVGGHLGRIYVWDLSRDDPPRRLEMAGAMGQTRFSADGRWLADVRVNGTVRLVDADALRVILELPVPAAGMSAVAVSPDARLAIGDVDGRAWVYDVGAVPPEEGLLSGRTMVDRMVFSPDARWVVAPRGAGIARFSVVGGGVDVVPLQRWTRNPWIAFRPRHRELFLLDDEGVMRISTESWREVDAPPLPGDVAWYAFSEDGAAVLGVGEGRLQRFDLDRGTPVPTPATEGVELVLVMASGPSVLGVDADLGLVALGPDGGTSRRLLDPGRVRLAMLSADGSAVAVVEADGGAVVLRVATGEALLRLPPSLEISRAALSADGRFLAASGRDQAVRLHDVATGREVAVMRAHRHRVQAIAFAPDGGLVLTTGWEGLVASWDLPAATADPSAMMAEIVARSGFRLDGASVVPDVPPSGPPRPR